MAQIYTALLLAATINNLALIYLLLKRPERSAIVFSLSLFLLSITVWGIPQLIINWTDVGTGYYTYLDKFSSLGYVTLPVIFIIFSFAFTQNLHYLKKLWVSFYLFFPCVIFLFLSLSTYLVDNQSKEAIVANNWGYYSQPGILFPYFLFWLESLMIASIGVLLRSYTKSKNRLYRKKTAILIFAILIPLVFGTITDGILPIFGIYFFPTAVPLTTIMAIIIGYAIIRYELFGFQPQTILSSIGDGLLTLDKQGKIISVNEVAEKMIGKQSESLLHKNITELIGRKTKKDSANLLRYITNGKKLSSNAFHLIHSHKKTPISLTLTPVEIHSRLVGATVLIKDIRDEKKKEESKDEFISIASHELKTPITSIKLYADILSKKLSKNSSEYKLVTGLKLQVDRMVVLANDLLDLSRIKNGSMQLNPEVFDLREIIQGIIDTTTKTNSGRTIQFQGNGVKNIFGDKLRIAQVINNLISNAVKYSPVDTPVIVSVRKKMGNVEIKVKDYGQGIPAEQHNKIFNRYYRVNGTTTDQPSLGIGLYISASIVKQHKGKIWVESNGNKNSTHKKMKGSTFVFTLPIGTEQSE